MSSTARLRPRPTVTPTRRWECGGPGRGPGYRRRGRCRRRCGRRRRVFVCAGWSTVGSLVLMPALVPSEEVADCEIDGLGNGFRGRHLRGRRFPDPGSVFAQLLRCVGRDLGEDRLSFLSVFQDQRSLAGLGFGSAGFLLRVFHGCVPFLVGAGPCSLHGSAGDLWTGSDQKTAAGVTRQRHELSAQQLSFLGLGNERELTVPIVDHLDVFRSGRARRRRSQAPLKSGRIGHEGKPKPFGRRLAERQPLPLRVGDGADSDVPFGRAGFFYPKQVARVRPLPRLQLSNQVGGNLPAAIGQLTGQPVTSEALETHDIRSYRIGRRSITSIDWLARQVFQRSLVLSRVVDAVIIVSDPGDDSVGRLHPGLGLEPYPDRFARVQGLRDLWSKRDVKTLAVSSLGRREHLAGQLIVQALAKHDTLESRYGQLRIDDLIVHRPFTYDGIEPVNPIVLLAQTGERFLPPFGQPPNPRRFLDRQLELFEGLQPSHAIPTLGSRSGQQLPQRHRAVGSDVLTKKSIDRGQTLCPNIRFARPGIFELGSVPQLAGENFLRPPTHLVLDVIGVDSNVVAVTIDAPDVDVDMRLAGVVMVHRGPVEPPTEVALDLVHQLSREFFQIERVAIFRRDDESKLPLLAVQGGTKGIRREPVVGSVKTSRRAVSFDAVALQIPEMALHSGETLLPDGRVAALDHASPTTICGLVNWYAGWPGGLSCAATKSTPRRRHTVRVTPPPADARVEGFLGFAGLPGAHRPPTPFPPPAPTPEPGRGGRSSPFAGKTSPFNLRPALNLLATPRINSPYTVSPRCDESGVLGEAGRDRHQSLAWSAKVIPRSSRVVWNRSSPCVRTSRRRTTRSGLPCSPARNLL